VNPQVRRGHVGKQENEKGRGYLPLVISGAEGGNRLYPIG
jgi:hypothetical protein